MRAAIVTSCLTRSAGGILDSLRGLSAGLVERGISLDVLGLEEEGVNEDGWHGLVPKTYPFIGPAAFGYSPALKRALSRGKHELVHQHALWMYPSVAVSSWHKSTGRPYVVSPHGMLDPWALANSGWKKRVALAAFERRNLQGASCLHALCQSEADSIRALGLRNPVAVIPNGVVMPEGQQRGAPPEDHSKTKTLLFLGRLHPKKGLPEALRGWAEATRGAKTGWQFVIAGWDQGGHQADLKQLCGKFGMRVIEKSAGMCVEDNPHDAQNAVVFAGPAFGPAKDALLRSANAFILPSLSEGLPMSVLEAWAYGLPVLMTTECNLPQGFAAGAAIKVAGDKLVLADGLRELMSMPAEQRAAMGERGKALVAEQFTWDKIAKHMIQLYGWLTGAGAKPDFVNGG